HTVRDDSLLGSLKYVSKTKDYQKYEALIPDGIINQDIKDSTAYKPYYDFATGKVAPKKARKFKKPDSPKLMIVSASPKEPIKKSKRVKRPAKKSTTTLKAGIVIRDTLGVSVSKKKEPSKDDRGKGIELLLDATLVEDAHLKKALKKSRQETHKLQASGSRTDKKPGVPYVSKADSSDGDDESWGNNEDESDDDNADDSGNDDDGGNDANDTKKTDSDEEENPTLNLKDEEYDELYKDVNMKSKVAEQEEVGKKDAEMTDVVRESGSQEMSYVQVVEDAHMTLTPSQKTEGSKQSSPVSSKLASSSGRIKHSSTPLLTVPVTAIPATFIVPATTVPPSIHPITPIPLQSTLTPTPTADSTTISIPALPNFSSLFGFDNTVSTLEKESSQFK
ncbi:hypothetical protein Tco_0303995, partial [Tanacetum coccineum]